MKSTKPQLPWSIERGDYFHSGRELFVVEQLNGGRALMEDCKTGCLIDMPLTEVARLEPVRRRP